MRGGIRFGAGAACFLALVFAEVACADGGFLGGVASQLKASRARERMNELVLPSVIRPPQSVPMLPPFDKSNRRAIPPADRTPDDRAAIRLVGPTGMTLARQLPDGLFEANATVPTEITFAQKQVYRLRLTRTLPDRSIQSFYPTIEIPTANLTTSVFLAHSCVPVDFTAEDFAQAREGNLVVKVVYLPDPAFQDFSTTVGAEEVASNRLEPGTDPVEEARRRGTILAIIRMGNIDLEQWSRIERRPVTPSDGSASRSGKQ